MFDLPEDISNKKYISNEPEPVGVSRLENLPKVIDTQVKVPVNEMESVPEKPLVEKKIEKIPRKKFLTKDNLTKLIEYLRQKWIYFKTVQYPALYAKIYDLYYFELVPYRPIDLALKLLIIFTLLIIVFIVLMIFVELIRLAF
jgi:hypothetical protein